MQTSQVHGGARGTAQPCLRWAAREEDEGMEVRTAERHTGAANELLQQAAPQSTGSTVVTEHLPTEPEAHTRRIYCVQRYAKPQKQRSVQVGKI